LWKASLSPLVDISTNKKGGRKVEDKNSSSTSKTPINKGISKERWKMEENCNKTFCIDITEGRFFYVAMKGKDAYSGPPIIRFFPFWMTMPL
jgi:hypothetical protein